MTAVLAARVAARLRTDLGVEPEKVHGGAGEFRVLVDGEEVVAAGRLAFLGVLPSVESVVGKVRARLAPGGDAQAASSSGSSRR